MRPSPGAAAWRGKGALEFPEIIVRAHVAATRDGYRGRSHSVGGGEVVERGADETGAVFACGGLPRL